MATIDRQLAEELIANDGSYYSDPRAYAVLAYISAWGRESYAVAYSAHDLLRYVPSDSIRSPLVIWTRLATVQQQIAKGNLFSPQEVVDLDPNPN